MPKFDYVALNAQGSEERGKTQEPDEASCVRALRAKGLTPISIQKVALEAGGRRGKVTAADLQVFCQQMATMVDAGVAIIRALETQIETSSSKALGEICAAVLDDLVAGMVLSACFAKRPDVFDAYFVSMMQAGESTGQLAEAFERLAAHVEFQREMASRATSALRYPMTVMVFMAAALGVLTCFVIPAFAKAFAGFGAELPIFTRMLLATSRFAVAYGVWILGAGAGGWLWLKRWSKTERGALAMGRFKLRMPVMGPIALKSALARYFGALAGTYAAGLPIHQALELVAATTGNAHLASKLREIKPSLQRGSSLAGACRDTGIFPPMALQMIGIGEETGRLDELLDKVAAMYRKDVEAELGAMAAKIEPIVMVFMGVLVLIMALGIFLPIWDMSSVAMKGVGKG